MLDANSQCYLLNMQAAHTQQSCELQPTSIILIEASVTAAQLLERHINGYDGLAPRGKRRPGKS